MKLWKRVRTVLLLLAVLLGLYFGFVYVSLALIVANAPDYGKQPPERVFKMVLGYPPPPGVTNLRAEGKAAGWIGTCTLWLTFDYTDAALKGLSTGYADGSREPITAEEANATIQRLCHPWSRRDAMRMRRVGWEEVMGINRPELHAGIPTKGSDWTGWGGWLIPDRERRRAYIQASN